jgi:hypothetical protein
MKRFPPGLLVSLFNPLFSIFVFIINPVAKC